MTFDDFVRSLTSMHLFPESAARAIRQTAESLDDRGRMVLWNAIQAEYAQYAPLVQRKLERVEQVLTDVELRFRPKPQKTAKEHGAERKIGGMLN